MSTPQVSADLSFSVDRPAVGGRTPNTISAQLRGSRSRLVLSTEDPAALLQELRVAQRRGALGLILSARRYAEGLSQQGILLTVSSPRGRIADFGATGRWRHVRLGRAAVPVLFSTLSVRRSHRSQGSSHA